MSGKRAVLRRERFWDMFVIDAFLKNPDRSNGKPHAIHPFEFMARSRDPELAAARERFLAAVDLSAIETLLDSIPTEAFGCPVLSDERREAHKRLLRYRLEHGFNMK